VRHLSVRLTLSLVFALTVLVSASIANAQAPPRDEPRVALVIGNSAYKDAPLKNPVNDVRAMAATLRELGFTVLAHENANKRTMETAVIEFGRRLAAGGVGFFYYAGHGLQVRGRNYLVPVDAEIDSEAITRVAAVDVELLLEQMAEAKNRVNVVILDACRNNPFERKLRGASRGLAAVDAARGTLIAYATSPGSVAADGEGANGLYTEELLKALKVPNLKVEEVFKQVRVNVAERSKGAQTPWESSSLTGDLIVNVTINVTVAAPKTSAPVTTAAVAPQTGTDREALFWSSIKDSDDPAVFEAYLKQFPNGMFVPLAKQKLATTTQARSLSASRFDGIWNVTVECSQTTGADGYILHFLGHIKDGVLTAQNGIEGRPSSLTLTGSIAADGTGTIQARGITGNPNLTVGRLDKGSPYAYSAVGKFEGSKGTASRVSLRPCTLTFVKQ
jgi:uncharacterized caspase-like protein